MSAMPDSGLEARFETMSDAWLPAVVAVEQTAFTHPWTLRNFRDALNAGYQAQVLLAGETLLGYFVAMEVRASNLRAFEIYAAHGFRRVGLRKAYYPDSAFKREDAIVMSLQL